MDEKTLDSLTKRCKKATEKYEADYCNRLNKINELNLRKSYISKKQLEIEEKKRTMLDPQGEKKLQKKEQELVDDVKSYSIETFKMFEEDQRRTDRNKHCRNQVLNLVNEDTHGYQFVLLFQVLDVILKNTKLIVVIEKEYESLIKNEKSVKELNYLKYDMGLIMDAPLSEDHSSQRKEKILEKVNNVSSSATRNGVCQQQEPAFQATCAVETREMGNEINQNLEKRKEELDVENEEFKEKQRKDQENEQWEMVVFNEKLKKLKEKEKEEMKRHKSNQNRSNCVDEELVRTRKENERILKEKQRENDEYEKETKRRQQEAFENFKKSTDLIVEFVCQQLRFQSKEKEWANWLKLLQDAIARAKSQYTVFESHMGYLKDEPSLRNELEKVYRETRVAYEMMYKAWEVVKQYSDNYEDKIFLRILLFNFQTITDKLCDILEAIDSFDTSSPNPEQPIRVAFYQVNAFEILSTAQLRLKSTTARFEDYKNCREPRVYSE